MVYYHKTQGEQDDAIKDIEEVVFLSDRFLASDVTKHIKSYRLIEHFTTADCDVLQDLVYFIANASFKQSPMNLQRVQDVVNLGYFLGASKQRIGRVLKRYPDFGKDVCLAELDGQVPTMSSDSLAKSPSVSSAVEDAPERAPNMSVSSPPLAAVTSPDSPLELYGSVPSPGSEHSTDTTSDDEVQLVWQGAQQVTPHSVSTTSTGAFGSLVANLSQSSQFEVVNRKQRFKSKVSLL